VEGYCVSDRPDPTNIPGLTPEPCRTFFSETPAFRRCAGAARVSKPQAGSQGRAIGNLRLSLPRREGTLEAGPGCLAAMPETDTPTPTHPRHLSRSRRGYGTLEVTVPAPSYPPLPQP
jgi:hypothetical protein